MFDLVVNRVLAPTQGGTSIVNNVGKMENRGLELSLNATAVRTKNLTWDLFAVYSTNRNKVVSAGSPTVPIVTVSGAPAFIIEGQPASVFFGTYYAANPDGSQLLNAKGLPQTEKGFELKPEELAGKGFDANKLPAGSYFLGGRYYIPQRDASGQPTGVALRKIIGNPNPDYTLSWGSSLKWKRLTFSFLIDGVYGVSVFNADKRTRQGVGIGDYAEKELRNEIKRGYILSIYPIEAWRIDDGSFTKIREVSVSYSWPKPCKGIADLTVALIGRNLYSFDNYNGYDPETNAGGTSDRLRGIDFGNIPIPRTYQLAVTAKF